MTHPNLVPIHTHDPGDEPRTAGTGERTDPLDPAHQDDGTLIGDLTRRWGGGGTLALLLLATLLLVLAVRRRYTDPGGDGEPTGETTRPLDGASRDSGDDSGGSS